MIPSRQRFNPNHTVGGQRDLGLKGNAQLAPLESTAQLILVVEPLGLIGTHLPSNRLLPGITSHPAAQDIAEPLWVDRLADDASMPEAMHFSSSPFIAPAVIAMIGMRLSPLHTSDGHGRFKAVHLRHLAVHQDGRIALVLNAATASRPLLATSTRCPMFSSIRVATRWLTALSSTTSMR